MNCKQAQNLFDTYLNGELSGPLATEFAAHKVSCDKCRRELALLEVAGHVIASDTDTPILSDEFTDRLLAACQTRQELPWYRQRRILFKISAPLAAAACLAMVLSYITAPSTNTVPGHPAPIVAGATQESTSEDVKAQVDALLKKDPDNPGLRKLSDDLQAGGEEFFQKLKNNADLLENYGEKAMNELVESITISAPKEDGKQSSKGKTSGVNHDQSREDL